MALSARAESWTPSRRALGERRGRHHALCADRCPSSAGAIGMWHRSGERVTSWATKISHVVRDTGSGCSCVSRIWRTVALLKSRNSGSRVHRDRSKEVFYLARQETQEIGAIAPGVLTWMFQEPPSVPAALPQKGWCWLSGRLKARLETAADTAGPIKFLGLEIKLTHRRPS